MKLVKTHILTRDYAFGVEGVKRVIHELSAGRRLVSAQRVFHDERVVAVVEVSGFVEEEAAVLDGAVVRVWDELRVDEHVVHQRGVVVQPADPRRRVAVHAEGETPVMLLLRLLQAQDPRRDWTRGRDAKIYFSIQQQTQVIIQLMTNE